jgi:nucleotide-binding universal stress UspA family protein
MKTILVPIDLSDVTPDVLGAAGALARSLSAKIVLAHVTRPPLIATECGPVVAQQQAADDHDVLARLAYWQGELQREGLIAETSRLYGQPVGCIREKAERLGADYIVLGSHGHGALYELLIGSTAADLLKHSPCPVLVVPVHRQEPTAAAR